MIGLLLYVLAQLLYVLALSGILITLCVIDLKIFLLPNRLTLGLLALGLLMNLTPFGFCSFFDGLLGSILGVALIYILNLIYKSLRKTYGIGMGDAKLLGALGAIFGYAHVLPILFIASLGCLVMQFLPFPRKKLSSIIAFGPYLCLTGIGFAIYQWQLNI
jgi:prepilin signal peptidase PulO-like enzyme (type II secretory pathway)